MSNERSDPSTRARQVGFDFDHRGHRVGGEIDLDNRSFRPVSETTPEEWAEFERRLRGQDSR
ncbi:hypothetical protein DMH01_03210 [Amycolatopsis sp. WAC 04182]|uniref:hypothetical protein n=1 Tax=Amycolatopsis sp. WAC 04182 TaxID=2203198 RepID=UPI000F76C632|nr:hypothetical protein [Amycolatopsis sp. WAC 04182]RSN65400.1 hypothetical protein DMH01_03210 [Amycolatopsis sp. WAC 04182]